VRTGAAGSATTAGSPWPVGRANRTLILMVPLIGLRSGGIRSCSRRCTYLPNVERGCFAPASAAFRMSSAVARSAR
jgi:hypothetical protein